MCILSMDEFIWEDNLDNKFQEETEEVPVTPYLTETQAVVKMLTEGARLLRINDYELQLINTIGETYLIRVSDFITMDLITPRESIIRNGMGRSMFY